MRNLSSFINLKLFFNCTVILGLIHIYIQLRSIAFSISSITKTTSYEHHRLVIKYDDTNTTHVKTKILVLPDTVAKSERPSKSSFISKHFSNVVNFNIKDKYFDVSTIVHPHSFVFTLQPEIKACKPKSTDDDDNDDDKKMILILCFVVVGVEFFDTRSAIRNTWAKRSLLYDEHDMQVFFIVGFSKNETTNRRVRAEAEIYKDILQENYYDRYHFMFAKIMGAFKWASTHCRNYHFLLRINDDIVVNTRRMVSFFKEKVSRAKEEGHVSFQNAIVGRFLNAHPTVRTKENKFYISEDDYPLHMWPPYVTGSFYFLTSDLAAKYFNLSQYVNWPPLSVWWEDIFMGMLSFHLGVDFVKFNEHYYSNMRYKVDVREDLEKQKLESIFFYNIYERPFFQEVWDYFKINSNRTLLF
jgi:hypothetical protein